MRGRTKLVSLATLLTILLAVSVVFGTGTVDVSKLPLIGSQYPAAEPTATTEIMVDPTKIIKDWLLYPAYHPLNTFIIRVNISSVTDLYAWQFNLTTGRNPYFNTFILNVSRIIPDEFLARSVNQTSSEELGDIVMNSTVNDYGYSGFSETVLGGTYGTGVSGTSGILVSIEFLIVGYGGTNITISKTGALGSMLLDSNGAEMAFDIINGYFSNKLLGDVNSDRTVNWSDLFDLTKAYGSDPLKLAWNIDCDFNRDNKVDWSDLFDLTKNYAKSV